MSNACWLATGKVRHIGIFVSDEYDPTRRWQSGGWRPVCTSVSNPAHWLFVNPESAAHLDLLGAVFVRRYRAAMNRPLCKRCVAVIADAHALTLTPAEQTP